MKKIFKIAALLSSIILLTFILLYIVNFRAKPASETSRKIDPIQNYKDKNAYIDGPIENFIQIYCNLVNNKDTDLSFLEDVVDKNSAIFQSLKSSITTLRQSNTSLDISILKINEISESQDSMDLEVTLSKTTINQEGSSKKEEPAILITLSKNNGYKITNCSLT